MKTKNIILAGFFLMFMAILMSCGTSVDIAKRQFNNGYYVHINTQKHSAPAVVTSKEELPVRVENNKNLVSLDAAQADIVISSKEEVVFNENSLSASVETKHPALISRKVEDAVVLEKVVSIENNQLESPKRTYFSKRIDRISSRFTLGGDAPTIVLILLCLFLPFIAVGIVDDWGTRFLISLLLTLLFWIPGVIYAFIVCFA